MMNLFENFDPSTNLILSMNWIMMLFPLIVIPYSYWLIPSRILFFWIFMMKTIYNEFKMITTTKYQPNIIMFNNMMFYIMLLNLYGLFPYCYTITSQMSFNLTLALSFWMSFMIYSWYNMPLKSLSHLVPLNTPVMLMNFMVLIELVSNLIRPMTLSIRLTANLMAGHLLMTLLGNFINNLNCNFIILMILIQNILLILEISMAFIQSYVYSILSVLYFSEVKK